MSSLLSTCNRHTFYKNVVLRTHLVIHVPYLDQKSTCTFFVPFVNCFLLDLKQYFKSKHVWGNSYEFFPKYQNKCTCTVIKKKRAKNKSRFKISFLIIWLIQIFTSSIAMSNISLKCTYTFVHYYICLNTTTECS